MVIHHLEDCQYCQGNFDFFWVLNFCKHIYKKLQISIYLPCTYKNLFKEIGIRNCSWKATDLLLFFLQKVHYEPTKKKNIKYSMLLSVYPWCSTCQFKLRVTYLLLTHWTDLILFGPPERVTKEADKTDEIDLTRIFWE